MKPSGTRGQILVVRQLQDEVMGHLPLLYLNIPITQQWECKETCPAIC